MLAAHRTLVIIVGLTLAAALLVTFVFELPAFLLHWRWGAVHTGECPVQGSCDTGAGPYYQYWSGFGSVWPWSLAVIATGATVTSAYLRKHNCHVTGCWRMAHYDWDDPATPGVIDRVCWRHHPLKQNRGISREDWRRRHHLYLGAQPGKG